MFLTPGQSKKVRETIKAKLYIDPLGQKRPPPHWVLTYFQKPYAQNQQNTLPPPPPPPPGWDKIAPRTSRMLKNKISEIWLCYISIDFKFYVISEKYKNEVFKTNRNTHLLSSGQHSLNWYLCIHHCIDTVQYI